MKKSFKYFAMAAMAILSMSACNKEIDEQVLPDTGKEKQSVEFKMTLAGANTRTTTGTDAARTTTWNEGDAVGIFVYKTGETTSPIVTNAKYVLTGNAWVAEAGSEIYPEEAYDYYAYYPYQKEATNPAQISISAKADQSTATGADYGASDVLASQNKNVAANVSTVPLTFKHMFAMVEVKINGDKVTQCPTKVELKGVQLNATLDLMAATPAATHTNDASTDITMYYLTKTENTTAAPFSFRAVVPAQDIAASTPLVAIYDIDGGGKTYTMQYSSLVNYIAGEYRQINVNIGASKVSLEIPKSDMTIDPWGASGAIDGDGSEVVTPVELFTLNFSSASIDINNMANYKQWKDKSGLYCPDENTAFWFRRENVSEASSFLTTVKIDNNQLVLSRKDKPTAWMGSAIGYHCTEAFEKCVYKITISSESSPASGSMGLVVTNNEDQKIFIISNTDAFKAKMSARAANVNKNLIIYIDFSKYTTTANSTNLSDENISNVTDQVIKHINIYLYNYNRTDQTNLDIKINSLTIEKYIKATTN